MTNFVLITLIGLLLSYAAVRIVQKYLPEREGKFVDADAYVLVFGQGLLVAGIVNGHDVSIVLGLILTVCAVNALLKKYKLRKKGLY